MPTAPVHQGCAASQAITSTRVVLLLRQVLVVAAALRVAAAAHVDADAGVAVPGEVGVARGVARGRRVVLAVRDVLEDGRHRARLGVLGQPDPRREPHAVAHRDPGVADDADRLRQLVDALHAVEILAGSRAACTPSAASVPESAQTSISERQRRG